MKEMLSEINVVLLKNPRRIFEEFKNAYYSDFSSMIIENATTTMIDNLSQKILKIRMFSDLELLIGRQLVTKLCI